MEFFTYLKYFWSGIAIGLGMVWAIIKLLWPFLVLMLLIEVFVGRYPSKIINGYNSYRRRRRIKKIYIDENGYKRFSNSDKLVHRWVAEKKLGRELGEEEVVHHRNEDKLDNRPSNLWVFANQDEHDEEHGYYNEEDDYEYDDDDYDEDFK